MTAEGRVLNTCISSKKGTPKHTVPVITLIEKHGVEHDAHAGSGHRQVSLLNEEDIQKMRDAGLNLKPGAFGENIVVVGIDLNQLGIGTRLRIGKAVLVLTQIGKVCHNRCAIYHKAGDCIMPRAGVFAEVKQGGEIKPDMRIEITHQVPRQTIQAGVLTASDRCARNETIDTSGPEVAAILENLLGAHVAWSGVVPDNIDQISERLKKLTDRNYDLIVTTGGTGCGPRDITPEATQKVIEREVPGLAEHMRRLSLEVTPNSLLQRGVCGIRQRTLIVNLPGSRKAASENLRGIIGVLPHAIRHIRGDTSHPEIDLNRHKVRK
ncbi:MOSC domain-containing protein [bacterium]|nr:MOSC domain-containing protein [bacterium]